MSVFDAHVPILQDFWASEFIDTCVANRVTGTSFNDTTGQTTDIVTEIYDGECLAISAGGREIDFGEERRAEVDFDLYLPHDSALLVYGDEVTVTADHNPEPMVMTVLRSLPSSYLSKRHYECASKP